jgi:hypothetical protein
MPEGIRIARSGCSGDSINYSSTALISQAGTTTKKHGKMLPDDWKSRSAGDALLWGGLAGKIPDHVVVGFRC